MTKQEIFDKTATALLRQGRKSLAPKGAPEEMCAYRSKDGLRCAIGHLIADECYDTNIEKLSAAKEPVLKALECSGIKESDFPSRENMIMFLIHLQGIHDSREPEEWKEQLLEFAYFYELDNTAIKGI